MSTKNEIVKSDIIAGGFIDIDVNGNMGEIKSILKRKDGSATITISPKPIRKLMALKKGGFMDLDEWQNIDAIKTEDAEFEVVKPLMIDAGTVQECDATMLPKDKELG